MLCMIAWGNHPDEPALDATVHRHLEDGLKGRAYVKVFDGAFVVRLLHGEAERSEIISALREQLAKPNAPRARILVSPPIADDAGFFNGAAPLDIWEAVNRLSRADDAS